MLSTNCLEVKAVVGSNIAVLLTENKSLTESINKDIVASLSLTKDLVST